MAIYHCSVKVGKAGKGAANAAYVARLDKYAAMAERGQGEKLELVEHGNMPAWAAHDPIEFWRQADQNERKNGSVYRELEVALPRELDPQQRRELVRELIERQVGDRHAYTAAIHCPKAAFDGADQPHLHLMYSERTIDGIDRDPGQYFKRYNDKNHELGGCRKDSQGTRQRLKETRKMVADVTNAHLEKHGHAERVSHLSLKDQGIDREPLRHIPIAEFKRMDAGQVADLLAHRAAQGALERAQKEVGLLDLSGDMQKAKQAQPAAEDQLKNLASKFEANIAATQKLQGLAQRFEQQQKDKQAELEKKAQAERAAAEIRAQMEAERERERQRGSGMDNLMKPRPPGMGMR